MKFDQFVKMALCMTSKYYNCYIKKSGRDINEKHIYIEHTINNKEVYVCILYIIGSPDQKYVVSYDKSNKSIKSYITSEITDVLEKEEVHA